MIDFNANFRYSAADGRVSQQGACRVQLDAETLTLAPDGAAPISFDLGDLDAVVRENASVTLLLYTRSSITINGLGSAYERFAHDLLKSYRDRIAQCLLVSDLKEVSRFDATFEIGSRQSCPSCGARARGTKFCTECGASLSSGEQLRSVVCESCGAQASGKFCSQCGTAVRHETQAGTQCGEAELRLYESNLAVLPLLSQGFQWRLAEIDAVHHEPNSYEVVLDSGDISMRVTGLGKRTNDFYTRVREAVRQVATNGARALHQAFPFLNPDQLQAAAGLLREGRSVPISKLTAIHPKIKRALADSAVDKDLKPYYEELLHLSAEEFVYAGYKLIRPEEQEDAPPQDTRDEANQDQTLTESDSIEATVDADAKEMSSLYWFFFPIAKHPGTNELANVVAWEASSRSGRATYFFHLVKDDHAGLASAPSDVAAVVASSVHKLNTALMALNFRRRPIYLSDDELEGDAQWRRYAIAARRIPELRDLRARFLGRALHTSFEAWKAQVESLIAKARV